MTRPEREQRGRQARRRLTDAERLHRTVPESAVVQAVIDYLTRQGGYAWRVNTGGSRFQNPGSEMVRFVRFSEAGTSDVFCVIHGRFIAVECKTELGKRSEHQVSWQSRIAEHGGICCVCRPSDWEEVLERAIVKITLTMPI